MKKYQYSIVENNHPVKISKINSLFCEKTIADGQGLVTRIDFESHDSNMSNYGGYKSILMVEGINFKKVPYLRCYVFMSDHESYAYTNSDLGDININSVKVKTYENPIDLSNVNSARKDLENLIFEGEGDQSFRARISHLRISDEDERKIFNQIGKLEEQKKESNKKDECVVMTTSEAADVGAIVTNILKKVIGNNYEPDSFVGSYEGLLPGTAVLYDVPYLDIVIDLINDLFWDYHIAKCEEQSYQYLDLRNGVVGGFWTNNKSHRVLDTLAIFTAPIILPVVLPLYALFLPIKALSLCFTPSKLLEQTDKALWTALKAPFALFISAWRYFNNTTSFSQSFSKFQQGLEGKKFKSEVIVKEENTSSKPVQSNIMTIMPTENKNLKTGEKNGNQFDYSNTGSSTETINETSKLINVPKKSLKPN